MANAAKSYFAMQRGLNTEAPLINFPDGYTTEEQNYELTIRGERRRRLGLGLEVGGELLDIPEYTTDDAVRVFDWENVANIVTIDYLVVQVGYMIYVFNDSNPVSGTDPLATFDLRDHKVQNALDSQVSQHPLESAFGRGHLFLFGKYTAPMYIEYNPSDEVFTLNEIEIKERDFKGVEDGIATDAAPTSLLDSHIYNLKNRGWTGALISSYLADQSKYPTKAMIPWAGLKRALTPSDAYDDDGIRSFDPAKLAAEYFQDATAPTGHFVISPFETSIDNDDTNSLVILSWGFDPEPDEFDSTVTVTITLDGNHGASPSDQITINDLGGTYIYEYDPINGPFVPQTAWFNVSGVHTVTATPSPDVIEFVMPWPNSPFIEWYSQYPGGTYVGGTPDDPTGIVIDFRPKAGAFFAGRAWYGGIDTSRLGGRVYFSQVIEGDQQYGKCYQVADPTDERISDLVASDGGVIVIPEASNVLKLLPYNSSLLVFASNGVWEIGPGDLGYFSATSYSVRKVTDSGAASPGSVVLMDNVIVYWGITDIYGISPNEQTGYLQARNLSERVINTFYNNIPLDKRRECVGVYDDLSKRIIWLYASSTDIGSQRYDSALVFDTRLGAFTPFRFAYSATSYVTSIFILKEASEISKVKYIGVLEGQLAIGEANNSTDYIDFDIDEPECYMITGYDSLRDPTSFKTAPYIWVFSRKTETGYDENLEPIRPSSTLMQARWEWADNASAARWGREQEVYRHQRTYVPVDSSDGFDDGVPVLCTKNKLRGKGRVLQLKFTAGPGRDSHLMGWKTNFTRTE